jgi:hypothetical protein
VSRPPSLLRLALAGLLATATLPAAFAEATNVSFSYVPYRFALSERWYTHAGGNAGTTRLEERLWSFDFIHGAEWVALGLPDRTLLGRVGKIRLRARGSAKGHPIEVFLHTHFMTFHQVVGEFTGDGEQELVFDAPPGPGWQWFGGENDGKLHGPLRLGGIRLEANGLQNSGKLELISVTIDGQCPPDKLCLMTAAAPTGTDTVKFPVHLRSLAQAPLRGILSWWIRDWGGNEIGRGRREVIVPLLAQELVVDVPAPRLPRSLKFAEAEFEFSAPGQTVPRVQGYWLAPQAPYDDPDLRPESPFGMGIYLSRFDGEDRERVAQRARDAGVKWSREDFEWSRIEPARGTFDWTFHDQLLDCARRNGITVYAIVAGWPSWTKAYTPEGVDDYVAFLRALVDRYQNRIQQWEIWNEPNIFFWDGPKDLYAELLTRSYRAIKETDPKAEVLGISTAGIDFKFIERMLAKQTPFDVLTIHPYRKVLDDAVFIDDLRKVSDLVKLPDGRRRPVWLTEMGWATHVPHHVLGQDFQPNTQRLQAGLIARSYLCSFVSGVEPRTFWYDFRDDGDDAFYFEHNMGIVHQDLRPKPAYQAYATLARVLKDLKLDGPVEAGAGNFAYRFVSGTGSGSTVIAVWNPKIEAVAGIKLQAKRAVVVNTIGEEHEVKTEKARGPAGARMLQLKLNAGAPVYVRMTSEGTK